MKNGIKRFFAAAFSALLVLGIISDGAVFSRVRAEGKKTTVNLDIGEEVHYGNYHTRFYTVDGQIAYCLEPLKQ